MKHMAIFLPSLAGFAALALATERQQLEQLGRALPARICVALRIAGWSALAIALAIAVAGQGWALGLVSYSGHTSLAAGMVFVVLIVRNRSRRP